MWEADMRWLKSKFMRSQAGLAFVEFAITLPFLVILFLGGVELTRYIIIVQKVEKAAFTMSDVVAQSQTINTTQLNQLVEAVQQMMLPFPFGSSGYVIVTSVTKTGTAAPVINWQYTGGGSWTQSSTVGTTIGANAVLPTGFNMTDKENVIIAEVYYNFSPMFAAGMLKGKTIYKMSLFRPRLGDLSALGT
jgi:Flp pilus assembly protein TadG